LGARKNPTKLAKRMGVKGANAVSFVRSKVVLMGVRVTAAFSAAIVQIMARAGFSPGIKTAIALPIQAPVKKSGMINPPRHPPVTVTPMATILANANVKRKMTGELLSRTDSNS
jgi:hypothetical protein